MDRRHALFALTAGFSLPLGVWLYRRLYGSSATDGTSGSHETNEPLLRPTPLTIWGTFPLPEVVDRQRLVAALKCLVPWWETTTASSVLHALRLWGPRARFPATSPYPVPEGSYALHGHDMLRFFTRQTSFESFFRSPAPYFRRTQQGVSVRTLSRDPSATAHRDDFIALAAELALPLDARFDWGDTPFTLRELFHYSFQYFHPEWELEFTAVAYAHYLPPSDSWTNRFGERYCFDRLAELLVSTDLTTCACYGTHVPYALAALLAADEQIPVLTPAIRGLAGDRLRGFSSCLVELQGAAGWWDRRWTPERSSTPKFEHQEMEWVRSTGHHLEWMALVAPDLRPPEIVIRRAAEFLIQALETRGTYRLSQTVEYNPYSHAARTLVLLAGEQFAADVLEPFWEHKPTEAVSSP